MHISVIGLGYIGLPTACLLAQAGHEVDGYDIDENKLRLLEQGKAPFAEKGLPELLDAVVKMKTFHVTRTLKKSDVFLIAVPTPDKDHKADLRFVFQAVQSVRAVLEDGNLVIIESTIAPRACVDEIAPLLQATGKKFLLAHCPERAIPGSTIEEMVHNDRIVGGTTPQAAQKTAALYKTFVQGHVYSTDTTTAECCKVMENTFRDVNIALANEFCAISEEVGIDVWEAIALANKHPRVKIHQPGPGVGGHCIPVDPWFFVGISKQAKLIKTARTINDNVPKRVVDHLETLIAKYNIAKPVVGVLGVSYKKNVDDARETPATEILHQLEERKIPFLVHDPFVTRFHTQLHPLDEVLDKANVLLLVTDHDAYLQTPFDEHKNIVFIYDTRNILRARGLKATLYTLGDHKEQA